MKVFLNEYDQETLEKAESLLFNGNGFIGLRGNLEEAYYDHFATNRETYINAFYETKEVRYPEKMHGFTPTSESMISVVDGQTTLITIGDEAFRIDQGEVLASTRYVDLAQGITVRDVLWRSPKGFETKISITRLASFDHKNLFLLKADFEKQNHDLPIEIETHLNFKPIRTIDKNDPRMNHDELKLTVDEIDLGEQTCRFTTHQSKLSATLQWQIEGSGTTAVVENERIVLKTKLASNTYLKKLSYSFGEQGHEGLTLSFAALAEKQAAYLADFWQTAKITIKSHDQLEESVNYSTYALLQSLGSNGTSSIAAKGLSGSGYEGHYFWDTEMYIFPVFLHLRPELAKQLLTFRYQTLDKARENREMFGYQTGALYPWRTISGTESSAFFEAGSAQHHINADIAYAFIRYYRYTNDLRFMMDYGFEVLLETARVFSEIGYLKDDVFHLDKVTGPDEYTVLVNDNYYTNKMVAHQFKALVQLAGEIQKADMTVWQALTEKLAVTATELASFQEYAEKMALLKDDQLGIIKQDRDFLNKAFWPYPTEETKYPLLLHYHPLVIYRYQIAKQADAVLALMLFHQDFDEETIRKSVAYYDEITTHDSSLSYSAFSTVYSRLGQLEKGYRYFLENARIDLDNTHHNTKDGIHTASMGGTFMTIIYGFCHLQIQEDTLTIDPHLPQEIEEISFVTHFQGAQYRILVNHHTSSITKITE